MTKIRIFTIITITIVLIVYITLVLHTQLNKPNIAEDDENNIIITNYGDRFLLNEEITGGFIKPEYTVKVFDVSDENRKLIFKLEKSTGETKITDLYKDDFIKSYIVTPYYLLYQIKGNEFHSIMIYDLETLDTKNNKYLIPVAKALFKCDLYFIKETSDFLIKSGDKESIETIKRYAKGDFNDEELESIKSSIYSKEDLQKYFVSLVQKYKI